MSPMTVGLKCKTNFDEHVFYVIEIPRPIIVTQEELFSCNSCIWIF